MSRRGVISIGAAALPAAVLLFTLATLPPRAALVESNSSQSDARVVSGAFHVHTNRSDGSGSTEEIAAAAGRAGLRFVIFTDHGDGTRAPDAPTYRAGVLCLDGVEISTSGGHYIALGLSQATPYPLGGEPRDVAEDVARLGGFGVIAHPQSSKPDLRWRDWTTVFGGIEWLNADSEWRDEPIAQLAHALLRYPFRPTETMAALLDRPVRSLDRWDALARGRRIVALAGTDAHARLPVGTGAEGYETARGFELPTYEQSFRAFANRVALDAPPSGDAGRDGEALLQALRAGRVYTAIDALAAPAAFEFTARSGSARARMGDELSIDGPVELEARVAAPAGAQIVLVRNGQIVHVESGSELRHVASAQPAVFRVEVRIPGAPGDPPVPWIVSNPIYVGGLLEQRASAPPPPPATTSMALLADDAAGWSIERDPASRASIDSTQTSERQELRFGYSLWGGPRGTQYAALVRTDIGDAGSYDRLVFRARADHPLRLSVQIRAGRAPEIRRWQRSVYLDQASREVTVLFDEMNPIGLAPRTDRPDLAHVRALLLVVNTVNSRPGAAGSIWVDDIRLEGN